MFSKGGEELLLTTRVLAMSSRLLVAIDPNLKSFEYGIIKGEYIFPRVILLCPNQRKNSAYPYQKTKMVWDSNILSRRFGLYRLKHPLCHYGYFGRNRCWIYSELPTRSVSTLSTKPQSKSPSLRHFFDQNPFLRRSFGAETYL